MVLVRCTACSHETVSSARCHIRPSDCLFFETSCRKHISAEQTQDVVTDSLTDES